MNKQQTKNNTAEKTKLNQYQNINLKQRRMRTLPT